MTLTQLEHVLATHETGSFSRAARACGITQAAMSNSVAKLEGELGDRIFARTTRRIALTPFGEKLPPEYRASSRRAGRNRRGSEGCPC